VRKLRVGVLGATGLVGQQFIRLLDNHPWFELEGIFASKRSAGKEYQQAVDWLLPCMLPDFIRKEILHEASLQAVLRKDLDLVFNALPSQCSQTIEHTLACEGLFLFSNASVHRQKEDVPILIPEINPDHISLALEQQYKEGFIVTNSNCSTSGLVFGLKPIIPFGIRNVFVTTYQAISGAGRRGIYSLDILGNVIPFIPNEEQKIEQETRKILGTKTEQGICNAPFNINASCARVPVRDGHLESVVVELESPFELEDIEEAFVKFSKENGLGALPTAPEVPIIIESDIKGPQPIFNFTSLSNGARSFGMAVIIGRLRKKETFLNFFLLVHNTIRGAAGASLLNAEFAWSKQLLP